MNTLLSDELFQHKRFSFKTLIFTLNFVYILFGYQLMTMLISGFLPGTDVDSSVFTWPIRGVSLVLLTLSIILGRTKNKRFSFIVGLFIAVVVLYLIRSVISLQLLTPDVNSPLTWRYTSGSYFKLQCWFYVVTGIISLISIYRTWKDIDYNLAVKIIMVCGLIALLFSLFSIVSTGVVLSGEDAVDRVGVAMLFTISYGHFGVSICLIGGGIFFYFRNIFWKIIACFSILLGVFVTIRAGSRGPLVALLFILTLLISSYYRNILIGACSFLFTLIVGYICRFFILDLIAIISPEMALRMEATIRYGESSGRDFKYIDFFNAIGDSPIFGSHLDLYGYAHNIFLDSYVMYGVLLGNILPFISIIAIIYCYSIMREKSKFTIFCMLYLQMFVFCMLSSCWGMNIPLQCLLFLVLLYADHYGNASLPRNRTLSVYKKG